MSVRSAKSFACFNFASFTNERLASNIYNNSAATRRVISALETGDIFQCAEKYFMELAMWTVQVTGMKYHPHL